MPLNKNYRPARHLDVLGDFFGDPVSPASFDRLTLRYKNPDLALRFGLSDLSEAEWLDHFGRFMPLADNLAEPIAQRYHGHQFRHYNSEIGDGRGFTFAQLCDTSGRLFELGSKGSGQTPYSRFGDGRLTLKGGVRELMAAHYLKFLGVPTSLPLSLIETHESLQRHDEPSPARGSILVRAQPTHIRFGTFQYHAFHGDKEALATLVDYLLTHYFPPEQEGSVEVTRKAQHLLTEVVKQTAILSAHWMVAGFVHGVLNTDNFALTGHSFDYGPWRVLPYFDTEFTAAYFDEAGLYAYGRQPEACFWALQQFAITLRVLGLDEALMAECLNQFPPTYQSHYETFFLRRLGLKSARDGETDQRLIKSCLHFLTESGYPYALFFERGGDVPRTNNSNHRELKALLHSYEGVETAEQKLFSETGESAAPFIERVENLWAAIADNQDWNPLNDWLARLRGAVVQSAEATEAGRIAKGVDPA